MYYSNLGKLKLEWLTEDGDSTALAWAFMRTVRQNVNVVKHVYYQDVGFPIDKWNGIVYRSLEKQRGGSRDSLYGLLLATAETQDADVHICLNEALKNGKVSDDKYGKIMPWDKSLIKCWTGTGLFWRYMDSFFTLCWACIAKPGFRLDLVARRIFVRRLLRQQDFLLDMATKTLVKRQPENPWFELLLSGNSDSFTLKLLRWFTIGANLDCQPHGIGHQWSIQRSDQERPVKDSMGWEQIFLTEIRFHRIFKRTE